MNLMALIVAGALLLSACAAPIEHPAQDAGGSPAVTQPADKAAVFQDESTYVTGGDQEYEGFWLDHVLHSDRHADIHYNLYVPKDYNGSRPYAIYFTLPGWGGLYFQGMGANLRRERFGFEAQTYHADMIVVAPQLRDDPHGDRQSAALPRPYSDGDHHRCADRHGRGGGSIKRTACTTRSLPSCKPSKNRWWSLTASCPTPSTP